MLWELIHSFYYGWKRPEIEKEEVPFAIAMALSVAVWVALPCSTATRLSTASDNSRPGVSNAGGISAFGERLAIFGIFSNSSAQTTSSKKFRRRNDRGGSDGRSREGGLVVRAVAENEVIESKGLAVDGPGKGGQWLSSTTRHVRIYIGVADYESAAMDQTQLDKVTLMLDPDNEFVWTEDKVQKVYDYFAELVDAYAGAPCVEYTLRLIGSDVEHYIRKMLLGNEIKYNLNCRVLNFSMGKPRYESGIIEGAED